MKTYKGYSLFNDVEDKVLRAWNRTQAILNINDDLSVEDAEHYLKLFTEEDQSAVSILILAVSLEGKESIQKRVTESVKLEEDSDK